MSTTVKELRKKRASYKAKLTQFKKYLDSISTCAKLSSTHSTELNLRLEKIEEMYNEYDSIQLSIETQTDISDTEEYQEREGFEQQYFSTIASARNLLSQNTPAEQADVKSSVTDIESMPKESSAALRGLIDTINKNLRALNTLNIKTENWDVLIIHIASGKLDVTSSRAWKEHINFSKDLPTLDKFITFLKGQAELLESVEHTNAKRRHSEPLESVPSPRKTTKEEEDCEQFFLQTTERQPDGRFIVKIPLKQSPDVLDTSPEGHKGSSKRSVLSTIGQVFDPLGLINPCILQAKLIMQKLWASKLSWDEKLPAETE
ncbi:Gag-pol polyprotein, partial [Operophtera brumata]